MEPNLDKIPKAFIWRRLHSLTGLWLVIFLIEHLLTNSQAALLVGESGQGFIRMVNTIHNLPYLTAIEVALLGVPILIHMFWGVRYALTSRPNSRKKEGKTPHLKHSRNRAYTWQRITSWILVVLLILHIVKFRFFDYPDAVNVGTQNPRYFVTVTMDPGLYTVAGRLDVSLYDASRLLALKTSIDRSSGSEALIRAAADLRTKKGRRYSQEEASILEAAQEYEQNQAFVDALSGVKLKQGRVVAVTKSFGTASLLSVRDTFKSPVWVGVYTLFVLSACFHAFNGLWTSMLTWGWVIREVSQTRARQMAIGLMILIACLGLAAVWGTYFWNLRH